MEATVHWAPWAAKWFENGAQRRALIRKHEEGRIKNALLCARWKRKLRSNPKYFTREHSQIRRERRRRQG